MNGYVFLIASILLEVFSTQMMKLSAGFTKIFPTILFIIGMGLCFYLFSKTLTNVTARRRLCNLGRTRNGIDSNFGNFFVERKFFHANFNRDNFNNRRSSNFKFASLKIFR